jgi:hypothetical protein
LRFILPHVKDALALGAVEQEEDRHSERTPIAG